MASCSTFLCAHGQRTPQSAAAPVRIGRFQGLQRHALVIQPSNAPIRVHQLVRPFRWVQPATIQPFRSCPRRFLDRSCDLGETSVRLIESLQILDHKSLKDIKFCFENFQVIYHYLEPCCSFEVLTPSRHEHCNSENKRQIKAPCLVFSCNENFQSSMRVRFYHHCPQAVTEASLQSIDCGPGQEGV